MTLLGTYLAGTVPFAGEHLVEVSMASGGVSGGVVPAGMAVGEKFFSVGRSGAAAHSVLAAHAAALGGGLAGEHFGGGVLAECGHVVSAGQATRALEPDLRVCSQIRSAGVCSGTSSGHARYQGVGIRVDFPVRGELPQILF